MPVATAPRPAGDVAVRAMAPPSRRLLRPGWPLLLFFAAYPLWWLLGLSGFIWPVIAVPTAVSILGRRRLTVPVGTGIWMLFLGWAALSVTQVDTGSRVVTFAYRYSLYLSATVLLCYVYGAVRDRRFDELAGRVLTGLWVAVVAGGFAGIVAPNVSFRTPMALLLPHSLATDEFISPYVHPQLAQTMTFLGYPVPRPSALFAYTNEWGGAFAMLVPLAIWGLPWLRSRLGPVARLIAAAAFVPALVSLNRGLWITLSVGLLYAMVRLVGSSATRMAGRVLLAVVVAVPVIALSPLRGLVVDRLETGHSNNTRSGLYNETIDRTLESPLLGYGGPRPSEELKIAPPVGTQGQLWMVLFSHGFPGAALFIGFFGYVFARTWRTRSSLGFWCHVTILIGLLQTPVYGLLPVQIHILMVAAALALRDVAPRSVRPMEARTR